MAEVLGNIGYLALKRQSDKDTAITPSVYVPLYADNMKTNMNLDEIESVVGQKFMRYMVVQGQRDHQGEITVMAEPDTAGYLFDALLKKGSTSGGDPYTHPFTLDADTMPKAYTMDIAVGNNMVKRFIGAEISEISPTWEANEMRFVCKVSARKSFFVREIDSVTGSGPSTVTLKTDYDPAPTDGLVAGDTMEMYEADGTKTSFTITSVTGDTTLTTSTDLSGGADGDYIYIKPKTPSFSLQTPFQWARTEFCFGADAATALSATQTNVEQGSSWKIIHKFEDDAGAKRSGSYDPSSLVRTTGDAEINVKKFFDTPEELNDFMARSKQALVIRHYSETGYELRITLNNLKIRDGGYPPINAGEITYNEFNYAPVYDVSDGQGMDVKVINSLDTIS